VHIEDAGAMRDVGGPFVQVETGKIGSGGVGQDDSGDGYHAPLFSKLCASL
jgi:hypothetical protein